MHIPEKQKKSLISFKRLSVTTISIALLTFAWLKINALSRETVVTYDDLIIATVEKGSLIREIRAPGTLVPVELNYLSATSSGRVQQILLEASDPVEVGTVIMKLDNPELSQAVDAAKFEVEVLQAAYEVLEQQLHQAVLKQRSVVADFNARFEMAKLRRQANELLSKTGAVPEIDFNESILLEQQLTFQRQLEIERLESLPALEKAELAAARAQTNKALRHLKLRQRQAEHLIVRSSTKGILQLIPIEQGEQVMQGAILHSVGLLRGSFRPTAAITSLRAYLRHREKLVQGAASHIQRMQKVLVQMNLQLHNVISDITGVTGMRILRDIVAGVTDPMALAAHRDYRCRASVDEIAASLTGNFRAEHLFVLRQNLELFDTFQQQIQTCDGEIESIVRTLAAKQRRRMPPSRLNATWSFEPSSLGVNGLGITSIAISATVKHTGAPAWTGTAVRGI